MGINACILGWIDELAAAGAFQGHSSILELGPQDFFFDRSQLHQIAERRVGTAAATTAANLIFDVQPAFPQRQAAFYSIFGLQEYMSTDPYDPRADIRLDLNVAQCADRQFDVVADFGTTEHVFNAGNVFVFTHNALKVGGIAIKVLPTYGDNTHGFYNIHPTVYFDIARVNGYEMVDFRYIDNMSARGGAEDTASLVSADELAGDLQSFAGCARLQEQISSAFLASLQKTRTEGRMGQAHGTVDYCFVAMRKREDRPFEYPGQGVYLTEFG